MYLVEVNNSFSAIVVDYARYARETRSAGKRPVSFLNFIVGRY